MTATTRSALILAVSIVFAVLLYAMLPRYELRGVFVFDRWTGDVCSAQLRVTDRC